MKQLIILLLGAIISTVPATASAQQVLKEKMVTILKTPTGTLNVRQAPNGNAPIIGKVKPKERYLRVNKVKTKGWYQIKLNDGRVGWIAARYAKLDRVHPGPPTGGSEFKINADGVITIGPAENNAPPPPKAAPPERQPAAVVAESAPAPVASSDSVRITLQEAAFSYGRNGWGSDAEDYTLHNDLNARAHIRLNVPDWKIQPCLRVEARNDPYDFKSAGIDTDLRYAHWYGQAIACLGYQTSGTYETYIEGGLGGEVHDSRDKSLLGWVRLTTKVNEKWANQLTLLSIGKRRTEVGDMVSYKFDENWTFGAASQVRVHGTGDLRRYMWDVGPVVSRQLAPGILGQVRATYSPFAGFGASVGLSFTSP